MTDMAPRPLILGSTSAYRRELLGNLVRRFGLEIQGQANTSIESLVLEDLA